MLSRRYPVAYVDDHRGRPPFHCADVGCVALPIDRRNQACKYETCLTSRAADAFHGGFRRERHFRRPKVAGEQVICPANDLKSIEVIVLSTGKLQPTSTIGNEKHCTRFVDRSRSTLNPFALFSSQTSIRIESECFAEKLIRSAGRRDFTVSGDNILETRNYI